MGRQLLGHFARTHRDDRTAYLIAQGDETVGAVVMRGAGDGMAQIELDYVTPKYRDFTPGGFVFRSSELFTDRGFSTVRTPPGMVAPYYESLGFTREGPSWRLDLV